MNLSRSPSSTAPVLPVLHLGAEILDQVVWMKDIVANLGAKVGLDVFRP